MKTATLQPLSDEERQPERKTGDTGLDALTTDKLVSAKLA